jgi:phospholipase C
MIGRAPPGCASLPSLSLTIAVAAVLSGCGGISPPGPPVPNQRGEVPVWRRATQSKIAHIVIIVQENRSFNNLFYGYPGARTATYGYNSRGQKIELQPVTIATKWDLEHNAKGYLASCNGKGKIPGTKCRMNGFDNEVWACGASGEPQCPNANPPYSYVPQKQTAPYFSMARQYVLADEMYASDFDISSFISHQYIIAGVNPDHTYDYPDDAWGCPGAAGDAIKVLGAHRNINDTKTVFPCWDPPTLGDELDDAGLSWAFYAVPLKTKGGGSPCGSGNGPERNGDRSAIWSAYQAIKHICYGTDWNADVKSPPQRFLSDVKDGDLATVTWVTPAYRNSDHGGNGSDTGPSWVASLVNAIGESQFWSSTAIFIFWDDPGGWYDPEPPAYVDNDGLGYRLPLLIISPYAKRGFVSHTHYEHGSILKFVEDQFGLARLSASDKRAKSPQADCFDFNRPPRTFVKIKAMYDTKYFMNQPLDTRQPDDD